MNKSIGIFAPSSVVPLHELDLGVKRLQESGFPVFVHEQTYKKKGFFAGSHQERSEAFIDLVTYPGIRWIWAARGGYGSYHLIPYLEKWTKKNGIPPKKTYLGFSDSTALMEFVRKRWNWKIIHAPMPGGDSLSLMKKKSFSDLCNSLRKGIPVQTFNHKKLKPLHSFSAPLVKGKLIGGNLTVWNTLLSFSDFHKSSSNLLFFEDVGESLSRIDRVLFEIEAKTQFKGIKGIILGGFLNCNDPIASVLSESLLKKEFPEIQKILISKKKLKPLRSQVSSLRGLKEIFSRISDQYQIPIWMGLPVGHGVSEFNAISLGIPVFVKKNILEF
ncbi:MAG: hypothetical protein CL678_09510 [Bdellovibrionaceae bacterium]|nr:hypothetical protein [Pseudobdellovibrionaceae bacterium]|tara:strand:+ start:2757 stop:3746 length:990 start_codon:yes stop_codon:yes gene_type:complete